MKESDFWKLPKRERWELAYSIAKTREKIAKLKLLIPDAEGRVRELQRQLRVAEEVLRLKTGGSDS